MHDYLKVEPLSLVTQRECDMIRRHSQMHHTDKYVHNTAHNLASLDKSLSICL